MSFCEGITSFVFRRKFQQKQITAISHHKRQSKQKHTHAYIHRLTSSYTPISILFKLFDVEPTPANNIHETHMHMCPTCQALMYISKATETQHDMIKNVGTPCVWFELCMLIAFCYPNAYLCLSVRSVCVLHFFGPQIHPRGVEMAQRKKELVEERGDR